LLSSSPEAETGERRMAQEIKLAYGDGELTVIIPDGVICDEFIAGKAISPVGMETFRDSLIAAGFEQFLIAPPLVIVNDGYRNTPTAKILAWLSEIAPLVIDRSRFLIATGAHSAPTEAHLRTIFGGLYERVKSRIAWHDAKADETMTAVGRDRFGEEVFVNRLFLEHERVIVIGSVEPHYFAGFTGGRKAIFPGICDLKTIVRNHNMADSLAAQPMKLDRNPVAEHLDALLGLVDLGKIFSIQLVLDSTDAVAGIFCDSVRDSFHEAAQMAREMYACGYDGQYDVALCELLPPLDDNLYQVQKALENCQPAVRDGGACIVVAACKGGIGSEHFYRLADIWDRALNRPKDGVLRFGSHKLARVNATSGRILVGIYSELPADTTRHVYYESIDDLNMYLDKRLGSGARVAIVRNAGHTVMTQRIH
jgi:nickel-dependent lactate racemase